MKIRYITEIISNNIEFCKEVLKIVTELRHLEKIKGNMEFAYRFVTGICLNHNLIIWNLIL